MLLSIPIYIHIFRYVLSSVERYTLYIPTNVFLPISIKLNFEVS
jgi:hypothetical protein